MKIRMQDKKASRMRSTYGKSCRVLLGSGVAAEQLIAACSSQCQLITSVLYEIADLQSVLSSQQARLA